MRHAFAEACDADLRVGGRFFAGIQDPPVNRLLGGQRNGDAGIFGILPDRLPSEIESGGDRNQVATANIASETKMTPKMLPPPTARGVGSRPAIRRIRPSSAATPAAG
jgi:hypothetical protein